MEPGDLPLVTQALAEENIKLKEFIAAEDASAIKKATQGLGTDEGRLAQLELTSAAMVKKHGKPLRAIVESDVSGAFGKLIGYALMDVDDYGALLFTRATKGVGCAYVEALVDLVNTRTNAELAAIKAKWESQNDQGLVDCLNSEFGMFSKHFLGQKSESTAVDTGLATQQAERLHKAGVGRMGTDEDTFIEILVKQSRAQIQDTLIEILVNQSRAQIQAIKDAYERNFSMSLKRAIEKETSGDFKTALIALLLPSTAAYTALALRKSFEGVGTDKDRICRVLGGTDKLLMPAVCEAYLDTYGETLQQSLNKETLVTGDFLLAAMAWCQCSDPTKGLEHRAAPAEARAKAKHVLQERENLREHIADSDAQLIRRACKAQLKLTHRKGHFVDSDAQFIRRACKGFGTDDNALVMAVCSRTKEHLVRVDRAYHRLFNKSLAQEIKSETSGHYQDLLMAIVLPYDEFDAAIIKKACDGLGTNEQVLIECLAPRSNGRIRALKAKYDAKHNTPLIDRLNSELSGNFKKIIIALLMADRDENAPPNAELAGRQAQMLHDAGEARWGTDERVFQDILVRIKAPAQMLHDAGVARWGTDERVFQDILVRSSRAHIEAIKSAYERLYGHSLRKAIERETSGDLEDVLVALLYTPTEYYARQLHKACKGMGLQKACKEMRTNDDMVVRVLGSHDKNELALIAEHYLATYNRSLTELLASELSGNFKSAALTWVGAPDPLNLRPLEAALNAVAASKPALPPRALPPTAPVSPAGGPPGMSVLSAYSTVNMTAGQQTSVSQGVLDALHVGLGWQTYPGVSVDLDAGVVMLDAQANMRNAVFFGNKFAPGVAYGGDNRTGDAKGDDETIAIQLSAIPLDITTLVFTVHVYNAGASFAHVTESYARIVMPATGHVCAMFQLGAQITAPGVAFAIATSAIPASIRLGAQISAPGVAFAMMKRAATGAQGAWVYCALGHAIGGNQSTHPDSIQAIRHIVSTTAIQVPGGARV
ncbi:hypothetical protein JKP88DRAFT_280489 [Tribonema minus]|uniref:Annexin n=1 Tax=Tribonema minus TaxID=303371 RepID=A0A836CCJ5_9STRA|nr:hypothetical protein JKP88DRAFT_280489 [Tribonema minus]